MAKRLNTLSARLIIVVVLGHAVLLPLVFRGVLYIVEQSHEEMFIDHVRAFSRFFADNFNHNGRLVPRDRAIALLDSATLASNCVYAELWEAGKPLYRSELSAQGSLVYREDFAFNQNQDNVYYLSIPIIATERLISLRLGFDEQPTSDQILLAYEKAVQFFSIYVLISVLLVIWLSIRLTQPLRGLQYASREIASGQVDRHFETDSNVVEIREMAKDLEVMRRTLVGTSEKLQAEMVQRQELESKRMLLEKQLLQSQKLEMIGTLAGGMAHEFNNILVPIVLYTEIAIEALPQESATAAQLQRVLRSAYRAKELISQVLTFSRHRSEKKRDPIELRMVVADTLDMLRAVIPTTIEIAQDVHDIGFIFGDEVQIQQLIVNLCNNSAKAIGPKTGRITVSLCLASMVNVSDDFKKHTDCSNEFCAKLSITDTGRGIDPQVLERIFEPFFTTAEVGQGSGLGLAVVHGIVTGHGGEIKVTSEIGLGATVDIYLPVCDSTQIETQSRSG